MPLPAAPEPVPSPTPVAPVPPVRAGSLAELVANTPIPAEIDDELRCLAGAIYFESRSESLTGQLAVAHVVINRAESGRFAPTLCGVVYQRGQFSFVRGGRMPAINTAGRQWRNALAIAQIARNDSWKNQAPGALFFHATHVSPRWNRARIAQIDNHIFYR
jgi:spore germination cell wall hydrolase CwlJ-like protein